MDGSICVSFDDGVHLILATHTDDEFDDFAKILYPVWKKEKNITDDQVVSYFKTKNIDLYQGKHYEYVIPTIKELCQRIEDKKPLLVESKEIREKEKLLLKKRRKQKFLTMLSVFIVFYFTSCCMIDLDDKTGAIIRTLVWFLWAVVEVMILSGWDVKSTYSKKIKFYTVFSFLSIPIVATLFVFLLKAYSDRDFLNTTMLIFAPSGYFITWIIFLIHECSKTYINNKGSA